MITKEETLKNKNKKDSKNETDNLDADLDSLYPSDEECYKAYLDIIFSPNTKCFYNTEDTYNDSFS